MIDKNYFFPIHLQIRTHMKEVFNFILHLYDVQFENSYFS